MFWPLFDALAEANHWSHQQILHEMTFPQISRYLEERNIRNKRQERRMKRRMDASKSNDSRKGRAVSDAEFLRMKRNQERRQREYEARAAKTPKATQSIDEIKAAFGGMF